MDNLHRIRQIAGSILEADSGSHGWDHAERVWMLCEHIGVEERADLGILEPAAYLHDICRREEKASGGKICHARLGAERSREILEREGASEDVIQRITHCIAAHRFRNNDEQPQTLEARILFDADKLDALGAVGIGRTFLFAGEVGARLHNPEADILNTRAYSSDDTAYREFCVKLSKIRDRMLTVTGRKMAEDRHGYMVAFFERLTREVKGQE